MALECPPDDLARLLVAAVHDRVQPRVEQERDSRQGLDGAVVQLVREPPPLVLLGCDQLVRQARTFRLANLRLCEEP